MGEKRKAKESARPRKDIQLRVCVTSRQRELLQSAADRVHLPLTTWLRSVGLKAAEEGKQDPYPEEGTMKYRKPKGSNTWHWCQNCSNWPTTNYDVSYAKPVSGDECEECKDKQAANRCKK